MSDENNAGAAYLASLKQSTPQAAAAALAPDSASPRENRTGGEVPVETTSSTRVERRRSPRYRCQGSAHLRDVRTGVATWATFTDISLHGCYVEAMSTFRVGAPLALTIEVNGYRVESKGEVRIVYPNLGMGICFTTMSDPDRERLRELLRSLSRPSVIMTPVGAPTSYPLAPQFGSLSPIPDPTAALKAVTEFFEERHILSREEFHRILRKSQGAGK
ncbi:MAG: PilZ domain-containing protein [Candidatus Sulfotelmatobacter sp.]